MHAEREQAGPATLYPHSVNAENYRSGILHPFSMPGKPETLISFSTEEGAAQALLFTHLHFMQGEQQGWESSLPHPLRLTLF